MSIQYGQENERFRKTIFCSNNPNKELNPAKHILKRPMEKILNQLNQNDISLNAPKAQIMNINQQTYSYNKEVEQPAQVTVIAKKKMGKKLFEEKLVETVGKNIIVSPPINSTEQLNARKGSGHYYQGKNTESYMKQAYYPNQIKQVDSKKKMYESNKLNKETITTEMTNNVNHYNKYQPSNMSQRRQIPQRTSIQDCFNDFPQSTKQQRTNTIDSYAQYYSSARPQRSTTTHDSFKQEYNRPLTTTNTQNQPRKTNAYYKYGTSTTSHSSFYL